MQSKAKTVGEYMKDVPKERKQALLDLRKLCRTILVGFDEEMEYGMPTYKRGGSVQFAFASQKNSINLYVLNKEAMAKCRDQLAGLSIGKGCIRFPRPEKMDFSMITRLLEETRKSTARPC